MNDPIIRFTNKLDPNGKEGQGIPWPQWDPAKPKALVLTDQIFSPLIIENDNYRSRALDYVADLSIRHPIQGMQYMFTLIVMTPWNVVTGDLLYILKFGPFCSSVQTWLI